MKYHHLLRTHPVYYQKSFFIRNLVCVSSKCALHLWTSSISQNPPKSNWMKKTPVGHVIFIGFLAVNHQCSCNIREKKSNIWTFVLHFSVEGGGHICQWMPRRKEFSAKVALQKFKESDKSLKYQLLSEEKKVLISFYASYSTCL